MLSIISCENVRIAIIICYWSTKKNKEVTYVTLSVNVLLLIITSWCLRTEAQKNEEVSEQSQKGNTHCYIVR